MQRALILLVAASLLLAGCGAPAALPQTSATDPASTMAPEQANNMNLLLLGSDQRSTDKDPSWRTDTLIVVAIRPKERQIAMLSIPRDLWVTIPGYGPERINEADYIGETRGTPGGGPALVAATLRDNLGILVDAYARVRFEGLEKIIDAVGGVDVNVERAFDEWIDEGDGAGPWHFRLEPGLQHMDGRTALHYTRSRRGVADMDRSRRQQQVLLALRDTALRPEMLPRLPGLVGTLKNTIQTNLSPADAAALLSLALRVKRAGYQGRVFDDSMAQEWTTPTGAMVLLPNYARIAQVWAELAGQQPATPAP